MGSATGLKRKAVEYKEGDGIFTGYLVYPEGIRTNSPGVLLIPEWWGINDFAKSMADRIAGKGFVVFAIDMYGQGRYARTPEEAQKLSVSLPIQNPLPLLFLYSSSIRIWKSSSSVRKALFSLPPTRSITPTIP